MGWGGGDLPCGWKVGACQVAGGGGCHVAGGNSIKGTLRAFQRWQHHPSNVDTLLAGCGAVVVKHDLWLTPTSVTLCRQPSHHWLQL